MYVSAVQEAEVSYCKSELQVIDPQMQECYNTDILLVSKPGYPHMAKYTSHMLRRAEKGAM